MKTKNKINKSGMIITCLIASMMLFWNVSIAQINKNWYFGSNSSLSFESGGPIVGTGAAMDNIEGCATISNYLGQLLFFTDGVKVWNSLHQEVASGLLGDPHSTQSATIIPRPGFPNQYYIVTVGALGAEINIYNVTVSGTSIIVDPFQLDLTQGVLVCEKIAVVCKGDASGNFWLIAHGFDDLFYVWSIESTGASPAPGSNFIQAKGTSNGNYTPSGTNYPYENRNAKGYLKASYQGDKLALACYGNSSTPGFFELFSFNNMNGEIYSLHYFEPNELPYQSSDGAYGIEFSPNGSYFYGTFQGNSFEILQFETSGSFYTVRNIIDYSPNYLTFETGGAIQLAPDGKIYIAHPNEPYLSSISNPDNNLPILNDVDVFLGTAAVCKYGLPNFIPCLSTTSPALTCNDLSFALNPTYCKSDIISYNTSIYGTGYGNKWEFFEADDNCSSTSNILFTNYGSGNSVNLGMSIFKAGHHYKIKHTVYLNGYPFCTSEKCFSIPGSPALYVSNDREFNLGSDVCAGIKTVEYWFKLDNTFNSSSNYSVSFIGREGTHPFQMHLAPSSSPEKGKLVFLNDSYKLISFKNSWSAKRWYHVAVVIAPNTANLYIDGIQVPCSSIGISGSSIPSASEPTLIGPGSGLGNYNSEPVTMDELRFWTTERNQTEIQNGMHCQLDFSTPNLRAYYKMDEGIPYSNNNFNSPELQDCSVNQFNGSISNYVGYASSNWVDGNFICCSPSNVVNVTSCNAYTWLGSTYSASGLFTNTNGVNISTLDLIILQSTSSSSTLSFTNAYTWSATGSTYTASGIYTTTIVNANGCDSIITLNLTITPGAFNLSVIEDNPISCYGFKDAAIQATASPAGNYTYVIINPTLPSDTNSTGYFAYQEPGMHTVVAIDNNAPFSTVNNQIYIHEPQKLSTILVTDSLPNCAGNNGGLHAIINGGTNLIQPYLTYWFNSSDSLLNPTNYFDKHISGLSSGDYKLMVEDDHYCLDTASIPLTPAANSYSNIISACDSYTWAANGVTYSVSGLYTYTSLINGCADTSVLDLTINDTISTVSAISCDSYTWNGLTFTTSGVYMDQSGNAAGCINSSVLNLTINNSTTNHTFASVCSTYTWALNGVTYTTSGTYSFSSLNSSGCQQLSILNLQVGSFLDCYCTSVAYFNVDEDIFNLTVNGSSTNPLYANANGCVNVAPGPSSLLGQYSNFKTLGNLTAISQGSVVPFTIEENECDGASYNQFGTAIWIDYNHNGSFNDPGEQVYTTTVTTLMGPQNITSSFTVPVTATPGQTCLRAAMIGNGSGIGACGETYGETEDYLINIIPPPACTGAPNPGNTLANTSPACVNTTVELSLQNLSTIGGITFQWYHDTMPIPGSTNTTYTYTMQATGTYYCAVTCTNSGLTTNSNPITVALTPFIDCYCSSNAYLAGEQKIYNTTVAGGSTNSLYAYTNGCTIVAPGPGSSLVHPYSNFITLGSLTTVSQGTTVAFTIVEDECEGAPYAGFGTAIWIDYNHNGSFNDIGERVFAETTMAVGPRNISGTFIVPISALNGQTVMRIIVEQGSNGIGLPPCGTYTYGETEDYLINISPASTSTTLNLTCFIEGYMNGDSTMQAVLANQGEPTTATACDSIDVELRDANSPYGVVASTRTVLNQNGTATCIYTSVVAPGNYYIAVKHRNGLQTWSSIPLSFDQNSPVVYNFTTSSSQAYGSNQVQVAPGVWAFFSGDVVADENIDLLDIGEVENDISNFQFGYYATDINGDGNIDLLDIPTLETNISNFIFSNHP